MIRYSYVINNVRGLTEIQAFYRISSKVAYQRSCERKKSANYVQKFCLVGGRKLSQNLHKEKSKSRKTQKEITLLLLNGTKYGTINVSRGFYGKR